MSKEQNINDFLDLLRSSVPTQQEDSPSTATQPKTNGDYISEDVLKEQLRSKYFDENTSPSDQETDIGEYTIDNDFLNDVENMKEQEEVFAEEEAESEVQAVPTQEQEEFSVYEETVVSAVADVEDLEDSSEDDQIEATSETDDEGPVVFSEAETFVFDDFILVPEQKADDTDELVQEPTFEAEEDIVDDLFDEEETIDLVETEDEESIELIEDEETVQLDTEIDENKPSFELPPEAEELLRVEEIDEFETFDDNIETDEEQSINEEEPHETFIASMRKIGVDFANDRGDGAIAGSNADDSKEQAHDDDLDEDLRDEDLDFSTINLMMQFCEKDELDKTIGDEKVENYLRHEQTQVADEHISSAAFEGEEYSTKKQNDRIIEKYKHERAVALAKLCGCVALAIVAIIFELLPMFEINIGGLLDYTRFPAVYVLLALQFVIFSAVICYKQMWQGLKRAFSIAPSKDSVVAVVISLTALYDVIIAIVLAVTAAEELPAMFNGIAVITLSLSAAADYMRILAEMRAFGVYSSDSQKYTLVKESKQGNVASKMYAGGLPMENNVYTIKAVDFPRGFFKCVGKDRAPDKIITIALIPALVIGLIAMIVSIVLGAGAYDACTIFLLTVYAILPIAYIYSADFPNSFAALKLAKRGSAVAGEKMIAKYNDCNVIVFDDLHMFKKCKTEQIGIAMYDTRFAYLTLGCIDALYSKIGGPLSGMQMQLPDVFKFTDVNIRRITRSGVEAIVDKKHVVIVGDIDFMKRYGLAFPEDEKKNDRSTLCVSINGAVSAKLSVKYEVEPIFEMLVERLHSEGIICAIETYDPLINSEMLQRSRKLGASAVSVIHLNADDYVNEHSSDFREELDGMISCNSRLKLAEIEVWIKRQSKVNKILKGFSVAFSILGALIVALVVAFGGVGAVNQFHVLSYLLAQIIAATAIMIWKFPKKNYFTTDALYFEYEKQHERELKKQEKKNKD